MAASGYTPISLYHSSTPAAEPVPGKMVDGELAINIADGKLFYKNTSGVIQNLAGLSGYSGFSGATGTGTSGYSGYSGLNGSGGVTGVFVENETVVTTNYTLTAGKNAESVGPITINPGVTVTIPDGQRWVVL
jgi:hypothetical protein